MLEIKNLNKRFKEGFEIRDLSFKLDKGYIMGFIGPNGSGKTTTIKLMMNLLTKDSGNINLFGLDHIKHEKEIKDRIGFVYDESHFYEDMTMRQMKSIIEPFYSKWDNATFNNYMKRFDLNPDLRIKKLSKGMKMKYSLALALSHKAELIIMDEPTSGLDPIFRREILDILYNIIQDEDVSIFFSTHITTDLEKIADYITYINNGSLVFSLSKDEVMEKYHIIKGDPDILDQNLRNNLLGVRETKVGFEGLIDDTNLIKGLPNERIIIEKPSLEDVMYYTKKVN